MKKMLILGGNSKNNISWINELENNYSASYDVSKVEYDNWYNDNEMDFDYEIEKVGKLIKETNYDIILAKSIGMVIICYLSREIDIKDKKIVFMGYPKYLLDKENINIKDDIYKLNSENKLLLIQQKEDPLCSYQDAYDELKRVDVVEIEGNDHSYNDLLNINKIIVKHINIDIHEMKLKEEYYNYMLYGTKKIELRLNDEKRRKVKKGDKIKFIKDENHDEYFYVIVEDLLYYESFDKLIDDNDISLLVDKSINKEKLLKILDSFYTKEEQNKYGVVGIKIKLDKRA